jgi:hypothetical protein
LLLNVNPSMFTISGVMSASTVVEQAEPEQSFGFAPTIVAEGDAVD